MNTHSDEGVIKFNLEYCFKPAPGNPLPVDLIAWRTICYRLGLLGQSDNRYDGYAFGNISQRINPAAPVNEPLCFIVSGTQTGGMEAVSLDHFSLVTGFVAAENRITAEGPVKPSSEALTHGAVYASNPGIEVVIHVHCPEIWHASHTLAIPETSQQVPYGTPEMAEAVKEIIESRPDHNGILAMRGHEDGVVVYGDSPRGAGNILLNTLARAFALEV